MRAAVILICLVSLSVTAPALSAQPTAHEQLGRAFVAAVREHDFKALRALTPPLGVWRKLSPRESAKLKNKALTAALEKNVYPKLRRDFDGIVASAQQRQITLAELEFVAVKAGAKNPEAHTGPGVELIPLEVFYSYRGQRGSFALAVIKVADKDYLSEILLSYDVFSKLAPT